MNSRWLYFLLILALLLPATRPRQTSVKIAGSTPITNNTQGNNSQTEEEENHERSAVSRQTQRIARGSHASLGKFSIPQPGRFHTARSGAAPGIAAAHNGFGGHITC